jgi:hypothetical protein
MLMHSQLESFMIIIFGHWDHDGVALFDFLKCSLEADAGPLPCSLWAGKAHYPC